MKLQAQTIRIVIAGGGTGGHVQPAIAVAESLKSVANVELTWIGSANGIESDVAREKEIRFFSIPAGKLRRYVSIYTITDAFRIPAGIVRARLHLRSIQPDVIFSTGGFVSVPTVLAGWMAGIPVITHEQTATLGLANRINARFSRRVALAYETTRRLVPGRADKVTITGNPVRAELFAGEPGRARREFGLLDDLPLVYITGGSLGAQFVNNTVSEILPELVQRVNVIHQCGPSSANGDYPRLLRKRAELPEYQRVRYAVRERIGNELADVYAAADLVIGRSGAGTVAELASLGKPSILIPLPGTSSDEQTRNAALLAEAGGAVLIPQDQLSSSRLLEMVSDLITDEERRIGMASRARSVAQADAADILAREILDLANEG